MEWYWWLLIVFGGVWALLPIGTWVYILILLITKHIEFVKWEYWWLARYRLTTKDSWYAKKWAKWGGVGLWLAIITNDRLISAHYLPSLIKHEGRHAFIWFFLGGWGYILYILDSLLIFIFCPKKHAYLDNHFERDARRYAGQMIDIPKELWPDGPNDRIPWF